MNQQESENPEINPEVLNLRLDEIQSQLSEILQSNTKDSHHLLKPLGRYHDIYLLLIGFTLTAMVGGFISFVYQKKMYDYQKKAINYENKQREISEFYKNVSEIITARYLAANRLHTALEERQTKYVLDEKRTKYYETIDNWANHDAYNRAFIQNNFDKEIIEAYKSVSDNFTKQLHPKLRQLLKTPEDTILIAQTTPLIWKQDTINQLFFTACSKLVFEQKD